MAIAYLSGQEDQDARHIAGLISQDRATLREHQSQASERYRGGHQVL